MKNAIFGQKKRQAFWTEIILFSTFQVIVHQWIDILMQNVNFVDSNQCLIT